MHAKRVLAPILIGALAGSMLAQLPLAIADRSAAYDWFNPIIDVRDTLIRRFVAEPDQEAMQRAMIEGMIASLHDPHTAFVPADRRADFEKQVRGKYVGIGAEVTIVDGYLTIVSPMEGSPALEAGIMAGDVVLEVEGESTHNVPVQASIDRLMGEPNTPVTIKVRHLDGREEEISIIRRQIVTRTVRGLLRDGEEWIHCLDESLGLHYVRISQFTERTARDLAEVLEQLNARHGGLNGLVLDLRDNPGGSMVSAIHVADLFLSSGTIVSHRGRAMDDRIYTAHAAGTLPNFPMTVLVNGTSASASEIIAGALQENGRAKVIGSRTFGKASVQEVRELPFNQGTLKFTTAHYYLPSGRNINRMPESKVWGVDPDPGFVMPMSDAEYREMLRERREFEVIRAANTVPACASAAWIREHLLDTQLAAAVDALRTRAQGKPWPSPGQKDATSVALDSEIQSIMGERARLLARLGLVENRLKQLGELAIAAGRDPLLPNNADLLGGVVMLRDRHGNDIGTYRVDGGDIEIALRTLKLTPVR